MMKACLVLLCGWLLFCEAAHVRIPDVKRGMPYHSLPHVESDLDDTAEYSDVWAVKFHSEDMDVESVAEEHGFDFHGKVASLEKTFVLREKAGLRRGLFPKIADSKHVEWAEQQINRKRFSRGNDGDEDMALFTDPRFDKQWHINNEDRDLNVLPLWKKGIRGESCQVAIVDDGLQHGNSDLHDNYNPVGSYDFNYRDPDPDADRAGDTHGTSAAGCAAAVANGVCGVGAAPEASLAGIRLISKMASDSDEASALSYEYNVNHVYSNSWGPSDNGKTMEGPGRLLTESFLDAIQHGRNGKGSVYVWAGGNGKAYLDNGNKDGYNNRPYTISIGAYGYNMKTTWYSEECACLHAVAPSRFFFFFFFFFFHLSFFSFLHKLKAKIFFSNSFLFFFFFFQNSLYYFPIFSKYQSSSGDSGPKVVTTYMGNTYGTNCRADFGGTSAAAPMVAGVMCLLLGEYPDLTWRDVQHIVVHTAKPIDEESDSWHKNGADLMFSHTYGFGKIDAEAMLELAAEWKGVPELVYVDSGEVSVGELVNKGTYKIEVASNITIEHVSLYFKVQGITRGALTVTLESPSKMKSHMINKSNDYHQNMEWITTSNAHWGEDSAGEWKVTFKDTSGGSMTVIGYQLLIDGYYNEE